MICKPRIVILPCRIQALVRSIDRSTAIVVAARRGGEEGRHVGGAGAGEADVVGREGGLGRRLVAERVAEGRVPAAGEVEDGPVQERQQALHGDDDDDDDAHAQLLFRSPNKSKATTLHFLS